MTCSKNALRILDLSVKHSKQERAIDLMRETSMEVKAMQELVAAGLWQKKPVHFGYMFEVYEPTILALKNAGVFDTELWASGD